MRGKTVLWMESRATSLILTSPMYSGKLNISWSMVKWTAEAAWKSKHPRANIQDPDSLRWKLSLKNPCEFCVMNFILG